MEYELTIGWLYPDLMSTYGDRGNIIVLTRRLEWREMGVKVKEITLETSKNELSDVDLIFMGGAQDRQQKLVARDFLANKVSVIKEKIEKGIPALLVCAAYQFAGNYYQPYQGEKILGAEIFDLYTVHPGDQAKRLIGNITASVINPMELKGTEIVGFENHGGRTYLGSKMKALARVKRGWGNNGEDGFEGAVYKNSIGSYFHGPILTKNPEIADWLIQKALEIKYQKEVKLAEMNDKLEKDARNFILAR